MFKFLIIYKSVDALNRYMRQFRFDGTEKINGMQTANEMICIVGNDAMEIRCIPYMNAGLRGRKAHLIAIQEELTWRDDWEEIRDNILRPILLSPIDIQIFDGDYADAQAA